MREAALAGGDDGDDVEGLVVDALQRGMADEYHFVRGFCALALERVGTARALSAALSRLS
eukprot:COSAG01_NODE_52780_length_344_cov_0.636735_1_plen_59_part_01